MKRRTFLGSAVIGSTFLAGCVGGLLDDDNGEPTPVNGTNECDIEEGLWEAAGQEIHKVEMVDEAGDLEETCAAIAAKTALETLDRRVDMDVLDQPWIRAVAHFDETWQVEVQVGHAVNEAEGDDECPPDDYTSDTVRTRIPERVSVSLAVEETSEQYECDHEITFLVGQGESA